MDIKSILSAIKEDKEESINKEIKEEQKSKNIDKNFFLEKEIEDLKIKYPFINYIDQKFNFIENSESKVDFFKAIEPEDLKNVKVLKRLILGK
ncbi:MAG: hypothetical protein ABWJ98_03050 [Hydrogenothermaceae bacterium]